MWGLIRCTKEPFGRDIHDQTLHKRAEWFKNMASNPSSGPNLPTASPLLRSCHTPPVPVAFCESTTARGKRTEEDGERRESIISDTSHPGSIESFEVFPKSHRRKDSFCVYSSRLSAERHGRRKLLRIRRRERKPGFLNTLAKATTSSRAQMTSLGQQARSRRSRTEVLAWQLITTGLLNQTEETSSGSTGQMV